MKYLVLIAVIVSALVMAGCGLISGTLFVSHDVTESLHAQVGGTLDEVFIGAKVDLTENDDWKKIDIDGVEDVCVRVHATNHLATPVSGQVWVTMDTTLSGRTPQWVRDNGFIVFEGLALPAAPAGGDTSHTFTCSETLQMMKNLDLLSDAVKAGRFAVWAMGDQSNYDITYDGVVFGIHVTGSL
jgi:hypothetical protein